MEKMKRIAYLCAAIGLTLVLASCARAPVKTSLPTASTAYLPPSGPVMRQDAIHTVGPGETLWRISKTYDVSIDDIMGANRLTDSSKLEMGQRLLIPQAAPIKPVITIYPSNKWKYIIVHHSATEGGTALDFYKAHRDRGWETIGYHFVIDNGSGGKQDGQIEATPRWTKQMDGAHCAAGSMNSRGIGICLVGNFNYEKVSPKQMESLAYLVNTLKTNYRIPSSNVLGHGKVTGAKTDCPGKKFPWSEFYARTR
ncbi:MAG: N-acetylmuramoyl-L-alanine amidase [Candidatus Omnitrophica bacterium]|nr:N-acetylmuramoyl-L-alanine amidase [Candidatus Omnitrophota bacterium]